MVKSVISVVVVGTLLSGAVSAQTDAGKVTVGGVALFTFRSSAGGYTPQQRADTTYDRLREILSDPTFKATDITVRTARDGTAMIFVKEKLLTTIVKAEAAANLTQPSPLAERWAKHLRKVLPGLKPNAGTKRKGGN